MNTDRIIIIAIALSSLMLTACNKDSLTDKIDVNYPANVISNEFGNESAGSDGLSSLTIEMEAALSVKKYRCHDDDLLENSGPADYRSRNCISHHMARGLAYGLSEEFGHVKADLTIKYEISTQQITGQIILHLGPTGEIHPIDFRGLLSSNNGGTTSRFHAQSTYSFRDKYFSGIVEIQNLPQLLDSNRLADVPVMVYGVFD